MANDFEQAITDLEQRIDDLSSQNDKPSKSFDKDMMKLKDELKKVKTDVYAKLTPWQQVQTARNQERPIFDDYIATVFSDFVELHGDRRFSDDKAIRAGFATIDDIKVMLIGFDKGRTVEDKVRTNFGMAQPDGYRKAMRLMKLAVKYNLPVVTLVDTPAAYPGATAEERGQAEAIARSITDMAALETPIVTVITGEGGSGGALGLAVADVVLMMSNAIYSVIPPEGCAAILWRDAEQAPKAAEALKITADELLKMGIIDGIIKEPLGGAHRDHAATARALKKALVKNLQALRKVSTRRLLAKRFDKYAEIGRVS